MTPKQHLFAREIVLADDQAYEFLFVYAPLPLKGAPGAPGNPVAIR